MSSTGKNPALILIDAPTRPKVAAPPAVENEPQVFVPSTRPALSRRPIVRAPKHKITWLRAATRFRSIGSCLHRKKIRRRLDEAFARPSCLWDLDLDFCSIRIAVDDDRCLRSASLMEWGQRTNEVGIRIALGASHSNLMVLRHALLLACVGFARRSPCVPLD